ncbi:MAG TPA: chain length determinant protein EpsF [Steroidobacteraceae bacterium]|jgi:chain length determinant protein EpsF|nr:chain length determinant protein EpsF [Steroidobacteraceae bacterium]
MTFQQLVLAIRARWKVLIWVLAATVAVAVIVSLAMPRRYTASTSVVVNLGSPNPVTQAQLPADLSGTYLATQLDIIQSPRVAQSVARALHLQQSAQMQQQWDKQAGGRGDFDVWAGQALDKNLEALPAKDSNVITIQYSAGDPVLAAQVANAFAAEYLDTNAQLVADPAKNFTRWFQARTQALRDRVVDAQRALTEFQREHGIVVGETALGAGAGVATDPTDIETARLQELSQELATAQATRADTFARQGAPNASGDDLPEVLQDPLITGLQTQIALQEAQLQQLGRQLGSAHPTYIAAAASLAALRQREAVEVHRVVQSLTMADRSSQARVTELRAQLQAQKARVLKFSTIRNQAAVLQADLDTAQRDYDAVTQRLAQTSLESQMQQTDVSVLTTAAPPLYPSSPRLVLNTAIGVLLGLLLGTGAVLWRELTDQRLRSPEQLVALAGVPVLGIIPQHDDTRQGALWLPGPRPLPALEWK